MTGNAESKSLAITKQCPRFVRCSVPICPLDSLEETRDMLPGESKCTLAKSIRNRIGRDTDLPHHGLTKLEWAARQRWNALSEAEKKRRRAELRQVLSNYKGTLDRKHEKSDIPRVAPKAPDKRSEIER